VAPLNSALDHINKIGSASGQHFPIYLTIQEGVRFL